MICRRLCSTSAEAVAKITADSRLVSGIQPTGFPHIGNYLGFIQNFVRLQNEHESAKKILFIADYHSISIGLPPIGKMNKDVRNMTASLLACGIDVSKTMLFVQNQVPEHTELSWILSSTQTIARLQRLTQYKNKAGMYSSTKVPLGLINYPVLQAADVLLYKGTHVPVGDDQLQHFNLIGHFVDKINNHIKEDFFTRPVMISSAYPRIKSLRNPAEKMSKSDQKKNSCIWITDSPEEVEEKVQKAFTDSFGTIEFEPATRPGISNLLEICAAFSGQSIREIVKKCKKESLDTVAFKSLTTDAINSKLVPIREEYEKIINKPSLVDEILSDGKVNARKIAKETLETLKERLGFYVGK